MQRWEYLVLDYDGDGRCNLDGGTLNGKTTLGKDDGETMGAVLNLAGADGWECYSYTPETEKQWPTWYFKRPVAVGPKSAAELSGEA